MKTMIMLELTAILLFFINPLWLNAFIPMMMLYVVYLETKLID